MNVAIIYTTISGNTEEVAKIIANEIEQNGGKCDLLLAGHVSVCLKDYDIVLFGSYTWGDGKLPAAMRKQLKSLLVENKPTFNRAATFGTGDTQYYFYCRAVDEMRFHLSKHGIEIVGDGLKIEQFCQGSQKRKVIEWINGIIRRELQ